MNLPVDYADRADAVEEASTLGLRPGEWPTTLVYDGRELVRVGSASEDGELRFVFYGADGALLAVAND